MSIFLNSGAFGSHAKSNPINPVWNADIESYNEYQSRLDNNLVINQKISEEPGPPASPEPTAPKFNSVCPNCNPNFGLYNWRTHERLPVPCGKYQCPVCGRKKAANLYFGIKKFFKPYPIMRLWTFTLTSALFVQIDKTNDAIYSDIETHYKYLHEIWRRFVTELRRSKSITKKQNNAQYVRVCEMHRNGYAHLHVLFTEFIDWEWVSKTWRHICSDVCQESGWVGSCNVKGIMSGEKAASYVVKYVLKMSKECTFSTRRYSKSGRVSIFLKRKSSGDWYFLRFDISISANFIDKDSALTLLEPVLRTTSQTFGRPKPPT